MRSWLRITTVLGCVLLLVACSKPAQEEQEYDEEIVPIRYEYGIAVDSFRIDTGCVAMGETLGGILSRLGASRNQINQVSTLPQSEFDVRQIQAGKQFLALYRDTCTADSLHTERLCYWVYLPDARTAKVLHLTDSLHIDHIQKPIRIVPRTAEAVIESSLWNAMVDADLPVELALELSEIYAWTIDFFGLQQGDSICVFYDEQFVDSARWGIGRIYAARFYHAGKWQDAYWFDMADYQPTDTPCRGYFDAEGNSLRKAFLKAPLNYKRISSRFTYARKHPVYKVVRPHTGVDYAAPAGTPVVAIGDGVVIEKGYKGGGGNTVKIRHNSTYTTAYLHLSKYGEGVAVGKHVSQGQVIGYVGSTGASTGPHLDFRVWKGDSPIDPLKMVSPPVAPVPAQFRPTFDSVVNSLNARLLSDSIAPAKSETITN